MKSVLMQILAEFNKKSVKSIKNSRNNVKFGFFVEHINRGKHSRLKTF